MSFPLQLCDCSVPAVDFQGVGGGFTFFYFSTSNLLEILHSDYISDGWFNHPV